MKRHLILIALLWSGFLFGSIELSMSAENVIGTADLGTTFSQFLKKIQYDRINKTADGWEIYKGGKSIMYIHDKGKGDLIVRGINIISPSIITRNGLHVGMSVEEFLKKYPNTELEMSAESDMECFSPDELQTYSTDGKYDSCTVLYVKSNDKKFLGTGKFFDYPTANYRKNGYIDFISIYKWK
jgi:hypothetical protein